MKNKIYQRAILLVVAFMLSITFLSVQEVQAAEGTPLTPNTTDYCEEPKCYSYTMDKTGYFEMQFDVTDATQVVGGWKLDFVDEITNETFYSVVLKESTTLPVFNFPKGREISIRVTDLENVRVEVDYDDDVPISLPYTITVKSVASTSWEQEKMISESESWSKRTKGATAVTLGKEYYGNLYTDKDDDLYKLNVSKNGYVTVKFNPSTDDIGCGYTVKLLSSEGKQFAKYNAKESVSNKYYLAKGTYYVDIQQRAGYSNPPLNKTYTLSTSHKASTPKKVTSLTKKNMKLSWKKVSNITGYEVSYVTKRNLKDVPPKTTKKTTYTLKDLAPNKTYYVKVRAYRTDASGTRVYGAWSKSTTLKSNKKLPALYTVYYDDWGIPYIYILNEESVYGNPVDKAAEEKIIEARRAQESAYSTDKNGDVMCLLCTNRRRGNKYTAICIQSYLNDEIDIKARGIVLY